MSRIPEHIIDQVRAAVDIVELVARRVELRKKGNRFWGRCPFHGDKDPSLSVDVASQRWKCFGCGVGGDVFDFVQRDAGVDFLDAVRILADQAGIEIPSPEMTPAQQRAEDQRQRLREICAAAAAFYQAQLAAGDGRAAREYLQRRGLADDDAGIWGLGWAPDEWHALGQHLAGLGFKPEEGLVAGVLAQSKGKIFDMFRGRVIIPLRDHAGRVVSLAGRIIGDLPTAAEYGGRPGPVETPGQGSSLVKYGSPGTGPKYLNGPETPIFNKSRILFNWAGARRAIREADRAVIVEGQFDALSLSAGGIAETIAPMGTAITEHHAEFLAKHTKRVILLLDGDEAGKKAAQRSLGPLLGAGLMPLVAKLPPGQDPDEFIRREGAEALADRLGSAKPLLAQVIDELKLRHDMATIEGQVLFLDDVKPLLDQLKDKVLAGGYINSLAKDLDLPPGDTKKRLRWAKDAPRAEARPISQPPASSPHKSQICGDPVPPAGQADKEQDEIEALQDAAAAMQAFKMHSEFDDKSVYRPTLLVRSILREHRILSDTQTGLLYVWTGKYWRPVHREELKKVVISRMGLVASRNRVGEAVDLIVSMTSLPTGEEMNLAPELLCVDNGMLDLDTGQLRPHDPDLRCTYFYPYLWTPADPPDCPWFKRTLRECLDNPEVIDEVVEFIGYCLWHRQTFKKALLLVGPKDCGKSMLQEVIRQLIGPDNCSAVDMADLEDQFQRVALHRKHANICGEVSASFFSSKAFMRLTGGDPLQAAYKGLDTFTFETAAKLIFSSNEFPRVRENSDAFYQRMLAVNFPRQFKLGEPGTDVHRLQRIVPDELPGIFHLAVARLYYLRQRGAFAQSAASRAFLTQYKLENDHVAQFLEERCVTKDRYGVPAEGTKDAVYQAYRKWCEQHGIGKPKTDSMFWIDVRNAHPHVVIKPKGPTQVDKSRPPYVIGLHLEELETDTSTAA